MATKKQHIAKLWALFVLCALLPFCAVGQNEIKIRATLNALANELDVSQEFVYHNNSPYSLGLIYFNDWANAYASKNTALAKRFGQEFKRSLHLAKKEERGYTTIVSTVGEDYTGLQWERTSAGDIIKVRLNKPLAPDAYTKIYITYKIQLPPNKYTPYGYDNKGNIYLKDWYLTPAVYDGKWHLYSNKNLEDLYTEITDTEIILNYPEDLFLTSNFDKVATDPPSSGKVAKLVGKDRKSAEVLLRKEDLFRTHTTPHMTFVTDLTEARYDPIEQALSKTKIANFIHENLGDYPHAKVLVSNLDYQKDPLYGINQLPAFIRPYEKQFQFEMKFLKTALNSILRETLFLNPRKEQWINSAIANYIMIAYVEKYYPDQKLLGNLSKIWGLRSFNLAKMDFNDQYSFLYNLTARQNLDQALSTPNDSLIKFNQKIANKYKAGLGLAYLADYIGDEKVAESIKTFYKYYQRNDVKQQDFKSILKRSTQKDINWFFDDYISTDKRIDYKIKKARKTEDSLRVTIKNKKGTNVPISMYGLRNDSVVSKYWFQDIALEETFTIPNQEEDRLVLNYNQKIPEFNQRDNWKSLGGFLSSNKKLKFTFFKDSENPYYNQVFYVPALNFNIYDGWAPVMRLYNKTLLERPFVFDIAPSYSFREKTLVGSAGFNYRKYLNKSGLYVSNYALGASTSHFNVNSRYTSVTPSVLFGFRPADLISNKREFLRFRWVNIFRDFDPSLQGLANDSENPDYSVFNARYTNRDNHILDYRSWSVDFQLAGNFSKLAFEYEYRKLFESNRQLNIRFFAGKFLSNNTDSDFFSFALDRPTDYLFDYGYLGRSEESGIYSQQLIIAEGGFKSFLDEQYRFSDNWLSTANVSFNLWRWIELYGDIGLVKNKGAKEKFVYDSGIRLNLVTDFFELYFPVHSNNGWEIAQPNYGERIRFIITVSPRTLTGLFTRQWF
ncbi:metalloprotease [Maribacter sp. 2307ULW6-5]|uniref:metalloprotease n=1 Tax=Maribacter sp. 2307ULW6-5 TaxID=3386275 RepID=UPI0039BCC129